MSDTDEIARELRFQAAHGKTAVEMATWLHERLGADAPYFKFARTLFLAFKIPVEKLHYLAAWTGFGRGGTLSDEELEQLLNPLVPRTAPVGE
jgi:hypothetical protein